MSTRYKMNKPFKRIIITLGIIFLLGVILSNVAKEERLQHKEELSRLKTYSK